MYFMKKIFIAGSLVGAMLLSYRSNSNDRIINSQNAGIGFHYSDTIPGMRRDSFGFPGLKRDSLSLPGLKRDTVKNLRTLRNDSPIKKDSLHLIKDSTRQ